MQPPEIVRYLATVAVGAATLLAGCAFTPPPISMGHAVPPVETSGRNHVTVAAGVAGSSASDAAVAPTRVAYSRKFGEHLHAGFSQSFVHGYALPQTRVTAALDVERDWVPHAAVGIGWGADPLIWYTTWEFGVRGEFRAGPVDLYLDPVAALSAPTPEAGTQGYLFVLGNAGMEFRPWEPLRISVGPTLGWAQPASGRARTGDATGPGAPPVGLVLFAASAGVTASF